MHVETLPTTSVRPLAVTSTGRMEELDSLRGLAAMTVFSYHCIRVLATVPLWLEHTIQTPAGLLFYNGHQAVILFFILSGFVLYLPYARAGHQPSYLAFITKRICRIYLPYLCAMAFVLLAYFACFRWPAPQGLSDLYSWKPLGTAEMAALIRDHIFFLGFYHREYFDGVTWTLTEEMRISFIYPLLAAMVLRWGARLSLSLALLLSALVSVGIHLVHHRSPLEPFHYAALFILGASLCANRLQLIALWQKLGRRLQVPLILISVLVCNYSVWLMVHFERVVTEEASDWLIALSASVFLIAAIANTAFSALLRHRVLQYLGRISYGMYLLHLPVLFVAINLLWTRLPHLAVFALALAVTLALASVFHLWVERPSMALGKRLARRIEHAKHNEHADQRSRPPLDPLESAGRPLPLPRIS